MTEEQKRMVYNLFGMGLSPKEVAEELGIDEMAVIDYFEENF